jgi:hypothetical protein
VQTSDLPQQRKPEPGAGGLGAEPVERLEHGLALGRRNALPRINDAEHRQHLALALALLRSDATPAIPTPT